MRLFKLALESYKALSKLAIREVTESDLEDFVYLRKLVSESSPFINSSSIEKARKILKDINDDGDFFLIAYIDKVAVGSVILSIKSKTKLYINSLIVSPDYQGKGIGSEIIERCLSIGRDGGYEKISLAVDEENHTALRLYQYLGFKKKIRKLVPADDKYPAYYYYIMEKEI